ncbi:DUF1592 domain-containing protein [Alienimonas chondri]|uniref:DUF1592 domain-containing protein n=1 Tax=Alienimonas chondri TaxID=2681879 RepID=A0ABX1VA92_9PLAN|nr:DUF1592 domain-containing protein [Alienimonas chondri]NNJ24974.1 hypothetical protein [Alienimonas chondri]
MTYRPASTALVAALCGALASIASATEPDESSTTADPVAGLLTASCLDCHAGDSAEAGFDLASLDARSPATQAAAWEKVVRKLRTRQMPPANAYFDDEPLRDAALARLELALDQHAAEFPSPGRTATFRRLTRTEYANAVRDLLGVKVDASLWLPKDESSHGFDNVTVGDLSPTRMDRYVTAARSIARQALGRPGRGPSGRTVRLRPDLTQENHLDGLPLGTRGGALLSHHFPRTGDYEIRVRLMRDRNEEVEGLRGRHELDLLLDRAPIARFEVKPPRRGKAGDGGGDDGWEAATHADVDLHLAKRVNVTAGSHEVGVAFLKDDASLVETARQPHEARFNFYRHPRRTPAVYEVTITGPYGDPAADSSPGDSPSRERILTHTPDGPEQWAGSTHAILAPLLRRAYRRPITPDDLAKPLALFEAGAAVEGSDAERFEAGIELALAGVLVNPNFLFRVERDPVDLPPATAYAVDDVTLASRLSFFLWSAPPDDELLTLAEQDKLGDPATVDAQVRRMLADPRAAALATNFAGQWLHLRNLEGITPDMRAFPDFDDNLRTAFRRETELLFAEMVEENLPVTHLIAPGHAWLNERLAAHYGIPHVRGSHFRRVNLRRVDLGADPARGGLLRHGSVLTVTSYATRTSPVLRGKWVLENLLGTPPKPPPDDIPALEENTVAAGLSVRDRLSAHRAHAACASCHDLIDPLGFAFENYDAVGRFRTLEDELPVDPSGAFPGGGELSGVADLERELLARPDLFVTTLTEKLLTYALGRGLDHRDAPAVRGIVRRAAEDDYRFASLIAAIVDSPPFRQRTAAPPVSLSENSK